MDQYSDLSLIRRAYAKQLLATAAVGDLHLERAFATVPREHFLGPGPWRIGTDEGAYVQTPNDDPVHLYTDSVVSILSDRGLNNGQPSFHVTLMAHAAPSPGEHVVHVGAGVGYYSAILAELVGPGGRVTAIEFDAELARRARINLQPWSNVEVIHGDGTATAFRKADVIFVSAGATRPADPWLDQLTEGGRLIVPLTLDKELEGIEPGAVFRIERHGDEYLARWLSVVAIFPCEGARDEISGQALAQALRNGRKKEVTRLYRKSSPSGEDCWLRALGWCLAYR
jgi:protein-L-isoaspartate(D-aspartate) O-methyltransferase